MKRDIIIKPIDEFGYDHYRKCHVRTLSDTKAIEIVRKGLGRFANTFTFNGERWVLNR